MTPSPQPASPTDVAVPVFYATTEGQTRRIAERLVAVLQGEGVTSRAIDVASPEAQTIAWPRVRAVIVGASLHGQRHQRQAAEFVDAHRNELRTRLSAFVSVSLSAASSHEVEVQAAMRLAQAFPASHGWQPTVILSIAGALAYSKYGFLKRQVMRYVARKEGAPTDTSRDYEFTDWMRVDALARDIATRMRNGHSTGEAA